jgi:branched-chain amino acid transport system permease protein
LSDSRSVWKIFGPGVTIFVLLLFAPSFLPRFHVYLIGLILTTGLLAMSLNLVLGLGGMYQFHHAVFYGIGAYTVALVITKTSLSSWAGFLLAPLVSAFLSLIIGLVCVRLSKLYFGMLQISLGSLVWAVVFRWYSFTGGDDGIHGISVPDIISSSSGRYYFVLLLAGVSVIVMRRIVDSPFGRSFQAVRDNPVRSEAVGINVKRMQLTGMVISGAFAGIAGSMFVVMEGSVFPELMFWTLSLEIIIMCLLGGWFTFLGPMLGAAIIVLLRTFVGIYTEYWTIVLGFVLMLLILFLPEGVLGFFLAKFKKGAVKPVGGRSDASC